MSIRPMLSVEGAGEVEKAIAGQKHLIPFPCVAQEKFDGFRVIVQNGTPMTRTLKPIPNRHVCNRFQTVWGSPSVDQPVHHLDNPLNGMDGEIIALDAETLEEVDLHRTQSRLNSYDGAPRFVFHAFDDFTNPKLGYLDRQTNLNSRLERIRMHVSEAALETNPERVTGRIRDHVFQAVHSRICERIEDIIEFEQECLIRGAEGIMLKRIDAPYKFGRSTLREFGSIKVKRFTDDEATIIGFTEKMRNENEATTDERGYTKRSSAKEGLVPAGTLGNLILDWRGIEFEIGTGWDAETAQEIWNRQSFYLGKKINFRYKGTGPNGKPLIPSFKGVRYDV